MIPDGQQLTDNRTTSTFDYFGPREDLFDILPDHHNSLNETLEICRTRQAMVVTPTLSLSGILNGTHMSVETNKKYSPGLKIYI